jgi:hypothetical protein
MPVLQINFDDVVRCRLQGDIDGEPFENNVHFRFKCDSTNSLSLADGVRNYFINQLMAVVSSDVVYNRIGICRVSPSPPSEEVLHNITPIYGAGLQARLPHQMSYLIKIHTEFPHHAYRRGRMYLPGITTYHWTTLGWSNSCIAQMNSIADIIKNEFAIGGATCLEWGVWSRGDHDTNWMGMRSISWSGYPCVQRSRRPHIP